MHSNAMNGRLLVFFQVTVKANFQDDLRKKKPNGYFRSHSWPYKTCSGNLGRKLKKISLNFKLITQGSRLATIVSLVLYKNNSDWSPYTRDSWLCLAMEPHTTLGGPYTTTLTLPRGKPKCAFDWISLKDVLLWSLFATEWTEYCS